MESLTGPVLDGIADFGAAVPAVAAAGIGVGVLLFGAKRLWTFARGLAK